MKTPEKCKNCGAKAEGAINGRGFCLKRTCVDRVIRGVVRPIHRTMRDILTSAPAPDGEGTA